VRRPERRGLVVVADTTPLNYLVQLEAINLLHTLFGQVLVPRAVIDELSHNNSRPAVRAWSAATPAWLEIVEEVRSDSSLDDVLGAGERDAISLATQLGADLVLIDEVAGRKAAMARNLNVAGTLAVLLQGSLRQSNMDFPASLKRLRLLGFRMSDDLEQTMLARYSSAHDSQPHS
jgi:predicted nucleic acid-binding protein